MREITEKHGSLLIFDEVITGFRLSLGGAQKLYGVKPDLTTLGKIVGGGMPLAVYGGRKEIMECVAPLGSVYQAGTLSGNPVAVSAGIATLKILEKNKDSIYPELERKSAKIENAMKNAGLNVNRVGSITTAFFTAKRLLTMKRQPQPTQRDMPSIIIICLKTESMPHRHSLRRCLFHLRTRKMTLKKPVRLLKALNKIR